MKRVMVNGRWPLNLPDHRADRPEWPYWEATRLAAMHHFIEPGDVVYDVGAEAGDFAALFATWGARPVLIEPNPKAWPTIKAVWEMNHLSVPPWATVMVSDLSAMPDYGYYFMEVGGIGWPPDADRSIDPEHGFHHIGADDDPTATLDELVAHCFGLDPDIITMDVEGGESHVLGGAGFTLAQHKTAWFVSVHPQFMQDLYGRDASIIHTIFKSHGYHGRFLCEDHEQHFVWTHPDSGRMFPGVAEDYYIPGDRIVL